MSLYIDYKYTVGSIGNVDENVINFKNTTEGTQLSANDLDLGGHNFFIGIRWHF